GVDDEGVLYIDEHTNRRVDARKRFHGKHRMKKCGTGSTMTLWNFDTHHAEVEQAFDEGWPDFCLLVHLSDVGTYFAIREFVHAVAKEGFVLTEPCQRWDGFCLWHL